MAGFASSLASLEGTWDAAEVARLAQEDTDMRAAEGAAWDEAKATKDAEKMLLDQMQEEFDSW